MIVLHRLRHPTEPLHLNHEMIVSVEGTPDTVIRLTTGDKIVVAESPSEVAELVRECRIDILSGAMLRRSADRAAAAAAAGAPPFHRSLTALHEPALEPVA
jgi:uncharacterized protein YlzI (FlbEa/FlbD family)